MLSAPSHSSLTSASLASPSLASPSPSSSSSSPPPPFPSAASPSRSPSSSRWASSTDPSRARTLAWLTSHRYALLVLACAQAFFASGIFYGWASLYTLFLESGVYRSLCPPDVPICLTQKSALQFIYTVASSVNLVSQLPWGVMVDRVGPRLTCTTAICLVLLGFVLLGVSALDCGLDAYPWAMCLIAGAGPGVQISLFHLSELFPTAKSSVLALVTGAFQLGFVVFLGLEKLFTKWSVSLATLCFSYCLPLAVLLMLGMWIWPDEPCEAPNDDDHLTFTSVEHAYVIVAQDERYRTALQGELEQKRQLRKHQQALQQSSLQQQQSSLQTLEPPSERQPLLRAPIPIRVATSSSLSSSLSSSSSSSSSMRKSASSSALADARASLDDRNPSSLLHPQQSQQSQHPQQVVLPRMVPTRASPSPPRATTSLPPPSLHGGGGGGSYGSIDSTSATSRAPSTPMIMSPKVTRLVLQHKHALKNPNLKGVSYEADFWTQLTSPAFYFCLCWMSMCLFWANFFIGTVVEQVYVKSGYQADTTRFYTDLFTLSLPLGVLGIPLFGFLTDRMGFTFSILCTSLLGIGYAALDLLPNTTALLVMFLAYSFFRTFLFSVMFSYLANEFGYRHFGLLSGILLAIGGLLGVLQYPLQRHAVANAREEQTQRLVQSPATSADGGGGDATSASDSSASTSASSSSPSLFTSLNDDVDRFFLINCAQLMCLALSLLFALFTLRKQRSRKARLVEEHERERARIEEEERVQEEHVDEQEEQQRVVARA